MRRTASMLGWAIYGLGAAVTLAIFGFFLFLIGRQASASSVVVVVLTTVIATIAAGAGIQIGLYLRRQQGRFGTRGDGAPPDEASES